MNETLVQQAQRVMRQGNPQEARHLLQEAVRLNPQDYVAWLMLASVTHSPRTALAYVEQAARIRPNSPTVAKARAWAENRLRTAEVDVAATAVAEPVAHHNRRWWLWGSLVLTAVFLLIAFFLVTNTRLFPHTAVAGQSSPTANTASLPLTSPVPGATPLNSQVSPTPQIQVTETAVPTIPPTLTPTATTTPHLLPKNVFKSSDHDPRPTWTLTPTPTSTPTPTHTPMPTFVAPQADAPAGRRPLGVGPTERWVDVNLSTQTLVAYEGDTAVLSTLISSGTWEYPTVTGQFRIYVTFESQTMDGRRLGYDYYLENVPYVMYFYADYALHGTFWHNNFGMPMSHGCVNMRTAEAGWLYSWVSIGTLVNVHY